jgi:hypothetical protein
MTDPELAIASSSLDDRRRAIATYTLQRWDTAKWGTGIDAALAAGSVAFEAPFLLAFSVAVAIGGWLLVLHFNRRMVDACREADEAIEWLNSKVAGREPGLRISPDVATPHSNRRELSVFAAMLAFSPAFAFLQWLL